VLPATRQRWESRLLEVLLKPIHPSRGWSTIKCLFSYFVILVLWCVNVACHLRCIWALVALTGHKNDGFNVSCLFFICVRWSVPYCCQCWLLLDVKYISSFKTRVRWSKTNPLDQCHTCNFIAQLYRVTKLQVWYMACRATSQVAQLFFRTEQCSFLCNFVAKMQRMLIGQFLFMRQSCSVRDMHSCILRLCRGCATKSRDKIAGVTSVLCMSAILHHCTAHLATVGTSDLVVMLTLSDLLMFILYLCESTVSTKAILGRPFAAFVSMDRYCYHKSHKRLEKSWWNGEYSVASTDDLIRFWRSKGKGQDRGRLSSWQRHPRRVDAMASKPIL